MKEHNEARRLFLQQSFGVLSTISLDVPGYPFGSVTPYCADRQCRPVIYISRIAQHTRNVLADPRVSLTILEHGDSDDVQARGRLTHQFRWSLSGATAQRDLGLERRLKWRWRRANSYSAF